MSNMSNQKVFGQSRVVESCSASCAISCLKHGFLDTEAMRPVMLSIGPTTCGRKSSAICRNDGFTWIPAKLQWTRR